MNSIYNVPKEKKKKAGQRNEGSPQAAGSQVASSQLST